jgi:hypothetical protein
MRIIFLTILFVGTFYYFKSSPEVSTTQRSEIDSIKLQMGAPDRIATTAIPKSERLLTVDEPLVNDRGPAVDPSEAEASDDTGVVSDLEHVEEVQIQDIEEAWNTELKGMLSRLEPMEGEAIHTSYLQAQESYQAELNALMDEKQQKETPEEAMEIEHLIGQLDYNHQQRLKDILGAHYEAVRDHYQYYMDSLPPDE